MINCSNRWYHKTVQFIIGIDEVFGLNYDSIKAYGLKWNLNNFLPENIFIVKKGLQK